MKNSIIQPDKECYFTKSKINLHKHHIFPGAFRKKSEEYGCWIWVRSDYHVGTDYAIHNNERMLLELKKITQKIFEDKYEHDKFMQIFKRNYI